MIIYCLCVEVVVQCVISFETCCVVQAATLQHFLFNNPAHYVFQFSVPLLFQGGDDGRTMRSTFCQRGWLVCRGECAVCDMLLRRLCCSGSLLTTIKLGMDAIYSSFDSV